MIIKIAGSTMFTVLCTRLKSREIFESAALRRFQKFLCTTSKRSILLHNGGKS